jgi:hypothetical protein
MTSFTRFGRTLAVGIAGLLASCGDGPASNVSYKAGPQVWDFFLFAAKDGPVLVEVDGNPFGSAQAALADTIADAMGTAFTEPFIKFTADRAAAAHPDHRMIWTLSPAPGYDMNSVCTARPAAAPVSGSRLEMRVAFCQSGKLLSAVHGWMKASEAGPDNPRWRALVAQMARQLVSTEGF